MPRILTIEEKPDSLRIWRNGQLIVNFHDAGFLVAQQMYAPDILLSVLVEYPGLLEDFIKQLRLDGKLPTGPAPQSTPPALPDGVLYHDLSEPARYPLQHSPWSTRADPNVPEAVSNALAVSPDNQTAYDRKIINDWHESILARIQGMEGQQS